MIEDEADDDDEDEDEVQQGGQSRSLRGSRLLALSTQGKLLQSFIHPEGHIFESICWFDHKLLVSHRKRGSRAITGMYPINACPIACISADDGWICS